MCRCFKWAFVPLLLVFLLTSATAQTSGAEEVFRSQLFDLHAQAISILDRVEKDGPGPRGSPQLVAGREILAIRKLIHGLDEEAGATDLESMRRGQPSSKLLLLIQEACNAIDGMFTALGDYIDTEDRAFLGFARENNDLAWSIRKVM